MDMRRLELHTELGMGWGTQKGSRQVLEWGCCRDLGRCGVSVEGLRFHLGPARVSGLVPNRSGHSPIAMSGSTFAHLRPLHLLLPARPSAAQRPSPFPVGAPFPHPLIPPKLSNPITPGHHELLRLQPQVSQECAMNQPVCA